MAYKTFTQESESDYLRRRSIHVRQIVAGNIDYALIFNLEQNCIYIRLFSKSAKAEPFVFVESEVYDHDRRGS